MSLSGSILASFPDVESVFTNLPSTFADVSGQPNFVQAVDAPVFVNSLFSTDHGNAPFQSWVMTTVYRWMEGIGMMPLAPPVGDTNPQSKIGSLPNAKDAGRQPCAIVRLSAPYGYLGVYWAARRLKLQPIVPTPVVNPNAVFFEAEMYCGPPDVHIDNTLEWNWAGIYLFYLKKPVWMLDGLAVGKTPVHTLQTTDNTVQPNQFVSLF